MAARGACAKAANANHRYSTVANFEPLWTSFREKMRDLGYSEGGNIRFELRTAEGKPDLLPELAAQVVHNNVSVIVAYLTPAIAAAKHATSEIPIVMVGAGDPVATGFVASLARPGGTSPERQVPAQKRAQKLWNCSETSFPPYSESPYWRTQVTPVQNHF
jgi:putative tryptophan/tyrosine transport system substrate-binding protein